MKTWIINKEEKFKNYQSLKISKSYYFHYSADLNFEFGKTINNNLFLIIGNITICSDDQIKPYDVLKEKNIEEFRSISKFWGGRWAVYFEGVLYTDFTCLYGIFWDAEGNLISNTFEIYKQLNYEQIDYSINNSYYLNWFAPPKTAFKKVKKKLPGTGLNLNGSSIVLEKLEYAKIINLPEKEIEYLLSKSLKNEAISIFNKYRKVYIALSAGYDSRLIYSIFNEIDPKTSSFTHIFREMNMADSNVPKFINKDNLKIYPKKTNKLKISNYNDRTHRMVSDMDSIFYGNDQWNFLQKDEVAVRGGVLELAGISPAHLENRYQDFGESLSDSKLFLFSLNDYRSFQHDSFNEYTIHYLNRNSPIRWSKQLYIDQRISGWLSYVELGLDLVEGDSIHLGNSENTINLMLSLPLKNMKIKGFHISEIMKSNKNLLEIPFNKNDTTYKIIRFLTIKLSQLINERVSTRVFH